MESMIRLNFPLVRFLITKKDTDLLKFSKAFVPDGDEFMLRLQKALLLGLNMDYRRPALLKENDVRDFDNPTYMIVADDDVFFPGLQAIDRAKSLFKHFKEAYVIQNCKHMPDEGHYPEIQQKIKIWLAQ
ncbi:MAG: alpha/beta hydrolase [Bacteroidetes bacterium]|nr:alpha/beta hydrolase [Bacteroidota bacterium]